MAQAPAIHQLMERHTGDMHAALPQHISVTKMKRAVMTQMRKSPELLKCTPESVMLSVMEASQLGLIPGDLGECYLIPYKGECSLMIGYRGMISLARRSGEIMSLQAFSVHENDHFKVRLGSEPRIDHDPLYDDAPMTHVYAVAQLSGGGSQFAVLSRKQIERIRDASPGRNQAPWQKHFDEMGMKSAIRKLFKTLPVSTESLNSVGSIDTIESGTKQDRERVLHGSFETVAEEPPADEPAQIEEKKTTKKKATKRTAAAKAQLTGEMTLEDWFAAIKETKDRDECLRVYKQAVEAHPDDNETIDQWCEAQLESLETAQME